MDPNDPNKIQTDAFQPALPQTPQILDSQPQTSSAPKLSMPMIVGGIAVVVLGFAVALLSLQSLFAPKKEATVMPTPSPIVADTPTPFTESTTPVATAPAIPTQKTLIKSTPDGTIYQYTSGELGISFQYLEPKSNPITVLKTNNTLCLSFDANDPTCSNGQSVEVFTKAANVAFKDAIQKDILKDIPQTDCFVSDSKAPGALAMVPNYQFAMIDFPPDPTSSGPDFDSKNAGKCPNNYRRTNGLRYFMFDSSHPTTYLFYNIGQFAISSGEGNSPWQDTVRILK